MTPSLFIVIVNYKSAALTVECLKSVRQEAATSGLSIPWRTIVVDNASGDYPQLANAVEQGGMQDWVQLIDAPRNGGFSYGNNIGIRIALAQPARPKFVMLLNPDTALKPGAVQHLVDFLQTHPRAGIAGCSFENQDGTDWNIAFRFPSLAGFFDQGARIAVINRLLSDKAIARNMSGISPTKVDWVAGACMLIRTNMIERIGMMDEGYFLYYEEVDFCLKANRAQWECWHVPASRVMHVSGHSTGVSGSQRTLKPLPDYWYKSRTRFLIKNYGFAYAKLADLAYLSGLFLSRMKAALGGSRNEDPPRLIWDFLRKSTVLRLAKPMIENDPAT